VAGPRKSTASAPYTNPDWCMARRNIVLGQHDRNLPSTADELRAAKRSRGGLGAFCRSPTSCPAAASLPAIAHSLRTTCSYLPAKAFSKEQVAKGGYMIQDHAGSMCRSR